MELNPYLSFDGKCEAAFKFYERCLGGKIVAIMTYGGSPMEEQTSSEWRNKIMHARLMVGDKMLMGSDAPPDRYEPMKGFSRCRSASATPKMPNGSFMRCQNMGRCRCRSRKPFGPPGLACSSINSGLRG